MEEEAMHPLEKEQKSRSRGKTCEIRMKVPFHDVDAMHVVWHGNYLKYFDMARFALLEKNGVYLYTPGTIPEFLYPVIRTSTKHVAPLRYGDDFICIATLVEARIKIIMDFEIRRADSGEICAKGRGEQVAVKYPEMEMMLEIPENVRLRLDASNER